MRYTYRIPFGAAFATLAIAALLFFGVSEANAAKVQLMKIGEGSKIVTVPDDGTWVKVFKVTVKPKYSGVCVVTASWMAEMNDGELTATLHTVKAARGPWVQTSSEQPYSQSAMTQAFQVPGGVSTKIFLNAANFSGTGTPSMQGTRIWAVCAKGGQIPSDSRSSGASTGPSN